MPKTMTVPQVMKELEAAGDEKVRERYEKDGAGSNVFGVLMGKIRALQAALGTNHALGLELWATGNYDARMLACMLLDPAALTEKEARDLLEPLTMPNLVDELVGRVLVKSPIAPALQKRWMESKAEFPRRAGWKILSGRIAAGLPDLDVKATLSRIEKELPSAPYRVQEGINWALIWLGVHRPEHRDEVLALGEKLGRWDPRPVPRGCTSTFVPEAVPALLAARSGQKTEARKKMEAASAASAKKKAAAAKAKPAAPVKKKAAAKRAPARKSAR